MKCEAWKVNVKDWGGSLKLFGFEQYVAHIDENEDGDDKEFCHFFKY
nr:hypothetical protein [Niabella aurantiaca]